MEKRIEELEKTVFLLRKAVEGQQGLIDNLNSRVVLLKDVCDTLITLEKFNLKKEEND